MGSPIDFFDDLCRKTDGGKKLPTWKGELYLELHRGVCQRSLFPGTLGKEVKADD
jgi:alpha-mannosidase